MEIWVEKIELKRKPKMSKIGICELNPNATCDEQLKNFVIINKYNSEMQYVVCKKPTRKCKDCKLVELIDNN